MRKVVLLSVTVLCAVGHAVAAPNLTNYVGNYALIGYSAPAQLVEGFYDASTSQLRQVSGGFGTPRPGESLVDVYYTEEADAFAAGIGIASGGSVSGLPGGGEMANTTSTGQFLLQSGGETYTFYPLPSLDLLLNTGMDPYAMWLSVMVRRSATAPTPAEIAGDWQVVMFSIAANLRETYLNGLTQQTRTSLDSQDYGRENEMLVDLFLTEEPEQVNMSLTFAANGVISGDVDASFAVSGGDVVVTVGPDAITMSPTPDRNVMVGILRDEFVQNFIVAVRRGTAPTVAGLAGSWRYLSFSTPATLKETWFNESTQQPRIGTNSQESAAAGELLKDVTPTSEAEASTGTMRLAADGSLSGSTTGTFSVNAGGNVVLNTDVGPFTLFPSPTGDFMVGSRLLDGEQSIVMVIREPRLDANRADNQLTLNWGGTSTGNLQRSVDGGPWETIGALGANGSSTQTIDSSSVVLYRIEPVN